MRCEGGVAPGSFRSLYAPIERASEAWLFKRLRRLRRGLPRIPQCLFPTNRMFGLW